MLLAACYFPEYVDYHHLMPNWPISRIAEAHNSNKFAFYHISVYATADKYDAPKLREQAAIYIKTLLNQTLDVVLPHTPAAQVVQTIGLRGILDNVYAVTGHWDLNDQLRKAVLDVMMDHADVRPIGVAKPRVLIPEVMKAAQEIPEFGRDMFLRMMGMVSASANSPVYLDVVEEVTCTTCHGKLSKVASQAMIWCTFCGTMHR